VTAGGEATAAHLVGWVLVNGVFITIAIRNAAICGLNLRFSSESVEDARTHLLGKSLSALIVIGVLFWIIGAFSGATGNRQDVYDTYTWMVFGSGFCWSLAGAFVPLLVRGVLINASRSPERSAGSKWALAFVVFLSPLPFLAAAVIVGLG
jgi:hypothetical protein